MKGFGAERCRLTLSPRGDGSSRGGLWKGFSGGAPSGSGLQPDLISHFWAWDRTWTVVRVPTTSATLVQRRP